MEKNYLLYEKPYLPDAGLPFRISCYKCNLQNGIYKSHWHEHIELLYIVEGEALIGCNSNPIIAEVGDLVVVNSNELHSVESLSNHLTYYCIIADISLFQGGILDACNMKYITPITQNLILFKNKIKCDGNLYRNLKGIIDEQEGRELGYELAIKSYLYGLLVELIRNHVEKIFTSSEYLKRAKNLQRLNTIFKYIEDNSAQKITAELLAQLCYLSVYHFYHIFKETTGKSLSEYINIHRVNKAETLLKTTNMNITEVAMYTGFDDINYFSRLFKKHKGVSPSSLRK